MKKYIIPINPVVFIWGLVLITISEVCRDYTRYFLYISILVIIPIAIINLIKQRKEDKCNGTKNFNLLFIEC